MQNTKSKLPSFTNISTGCANFQFLFNKVKKSRPTSYKYSELTFIEPCSIALSVNLETL